MPRWSLYIDESGDPASPAEDPVLAGLLVDQERHADLAARLREGLGRAAPDVPWPIHAWLTRRPAMYALWRYRAANERPDGLSATDAAAIAAWRAREPDALEAALALLRAGGEPRPGDLRPLDRALAAADPAASGALLRRAEATRAAIERVLAGLAAEERASGASGATGVSPGLLAFAVGEARRGDAWPAEDDPARADRYLKLLETILQRVADALLRQGGRHQVDIHALVRRLEVRDLAGQRRASMLHARHVAEAAAGATTGTRTIVRDGATVRLNPAGTPRFDERVHPALVVADYAANVARRYLPRFRPLERILVELGGEVPFPFASGRPGLEALPHPAATGVARAFLDQARRREGPAPDRAPLVAAGIRPWAREQAERWAASLRGSEVRA